MPTDTASGHPSSGAQRAFTAKTLRELLHRIEVPNANANANPHPGRYMYVVTHAWVDGPSIRLAYTTPPSDRTWGLARDTRSSLIDPGPWTDADDPALYYYLLDLEEERPGAQSREPDENAELIWWRGDPLTDLPAQLSELAEDHRYIPPPPDPAWIDHTPPPDIEPRRYADPTSFGNTVDRKT